MDLVESLETIAPFLREIFRSFVMANRTSNGKANRKIKYFMNPEYCRVSNKPEQLKSQEVAKRALSFHFKQFLNTIIQESIIDTT